MISLFCLGCTDTLEKAEAHIETAKSPWYDDKENLDYPTLIENIEEVVLSRPDQKSNGKFAKQKRLSEQEIKVLINAINAAQAIGSAKFRPDYFIVFTTKDREHRRIKVNGNTIKGYKNDFSYRFDLPIFLKEF